MVIDQARSAFPDSIPLNLANFSTLSSQGSLLFNLANPDVQSQNPYLNMIMPGTLNQLMPGTNPIELLALSLTLFEARSRRNIPSLDIVLPP